MNLDIATNRAAVKYTQRELFLRVIWGAVRLLFHISPRPCFAWRRFLLRRFGAKVGREVHTYPSTRIYYPWNLTVGDWSAIGEGALIYNLGPVTIGSRVTISHGAHLCAGTHDYTLADMPLLKPPIMVHDQAWICTEAFIGPAVTIGEGAVIGARCVVSRDVEPWAVMTGNPARKVARRTIRQPEAKTA